LHAGEKGSNLREEKTYFSFSCFFLNLFLPRKKKSHSTQFFGEKSRVGKVSRVGQLPTLPHLKQKQTTNNRTFN
jgi:hypothetical protein